MQLLYAVGTQVNEFRPGMQGICEKLVTYVAIWMSPKMRKHISWVSMLLSTP